MIVVLDTNVWISGLQFARGYGIPTQALERAMSRDVIATCADIEDEIGRVLVEKFRWEPERMRAALSTILSRSVRVKLREDVMVCRDPKDDMFLECARLAQADLLVAGDKDLLVLQEFEGTRIVTPAVYVGLG